MQESVEKEVALLQQENERLKDRVAELERNLAEYEPAKFLGGESEEIEAEPVKNSEIETPQETNISAVSITKHSSEQEKIALFMSLFRGRADVYAKAWFSKKDGKINYSPHCGNEWNKPSCKKGSGVKGGCKFCSNTQHLPFDEVVVNGHLRGKNLRNARDGSDYVVGIYSLLEDDKCYFLAVDFDGDAWKQDVSVFRSACGELGLVAHVERSRSGNGAHAWFFFEDKISANLARKLGSSLLTYTMSKRHEIKFTSYDRLFPNQDTMPKGGFGNLIALSLQAKARKDGNSVFVDDNFVPYSDQWGYLARIKKLNEADVEQLVARLREHQGLGEVKIVETEDKAKPWRKKVEVVLTKNDFPQSVNITKANMLYIEKKGISQRALNKIKRLAAFRNPEFYKAQAMRLSTYDKPRVIYCGEDFEEYLGLPRGLESELLDLLSAAKAKVKITDERNHGAAIEASFKGTLRDEQQFALDKLLAHDNGILSATTAFGKTVVAIAAIAERKVNTLILVHRTQLMQQWKSRLEQFLCLDVPTISPDVEIVGTPETVDKKKYNKRKKKLEAFGQFGAQKDTLTGRVDIAIMQSVVREDEVKDFVENYGMVIVDECHHVKAVTFERVLKKVKAKYVYGLSATPETQDGHHPITFMQCGNIRFEADRIEDMKRRGFDHIVIPRFTAQKLSVDPQAVDTLTITDIYKEVALSTLRNNYILDDVIKEYSQGRNPIVLCERTEQVYLLAAELKKECKNVIVLVGKLKGKERQASLDALKAVSESENLIIVATGKFIGEGFDEPRLDTLFLASPFSWEGTLAQYAGRLHRSYEGKKEVRVFDYIDIHIKVLDKMYQNRLKGYAKIGYKVRGDGSQANPDKIYDNTNFTSVFQSDILKAQHDIVIVSPYLRENRVQQLLDYLSQASDDVKVTVYTRHVDDFKEDQKETFSDLCRLLESHSITVINKSRIHQKYAIIDQKVVWYGSLNILSYSTSTDSLMRFVSREIAVALLNSLA